MLRSVTTNPTFSKSARPVAAVLALLTLLLGRPDPAAADAYVFDKSHTEIRVSWDHLGLSRQSARFLEFDGVVEFDPAKPEAGRADVSIKVASIATGVRDLDRHLVQSKDFFDVERFPSMVFKSTGVRKTSDKSGEVEGELTINGITRPVVLLVVWNFTGEHPLSKFNPSYQGKQVSGFSATATIRRADWEIKRFVPLVSDELVITIETELLKR